MRPLSLIVAAFLSLTALASAEVKTREITYKDGNVECRGYLAWDDALTGPRPGCWSSTSGGG